MIRLAVHFLLRLVIDSFQSLKFFACVESAATGTLNPSKSMFDFMGCCVVCGRETEKVLFKKAIVKTHISSEECLHKYLGTVRVQKKLEQDDGWLD